MKATKVTLRKREYPSGKISLYLDYYPAIRDPRTMKMTRREYLGIYILKNPRTTQDRKLNASKLKSAEAIRAQRELSLINEQYGFLDSTKCKASVIEYFYSILPYHNKKWLAVYEHFYNYTHGQCTFDELTVDFCNGFRDSLLNRNCLRSERYKLSTNSASGYWSTFRAFLKIAFKEGYLKENVNDFLEKIEPKETRREYLTEEELNALYNTPCDIPDLREASLFSCLSGLRLSDILQLRWGNIQEYPDGGYCVRIRTEKTETEATIPISQEAYNLCGEPSEGLVFKNLSRGVINYHLKHWLRSAGITKHISFHCSRHCIFSYSLETRILQKQTFR